MSHWTGLLLPHAAFYAAVPARKLLLGTKVLTSKPIASFINRGRDALLRANGKPRFGKRPELHSDELPSEPARLLRDVPAADPRQMVRKRLYNAGKLFFGDDAAFVIDCVISDLTEDGARVQVDTSTAVAAEFWLVHLRDHTAYRATVAWRQHGSIGLKLTSRHDLKNPETSEMKALGQYCDQHSLRSGDVRS